MAMSSLTFLSVNLCLRNEFIWRRVSDNPESSSAGSDLKFVIFAWRITETADQPPQKAAEATKISFTEGFRRGDHREYHSGSGQSIYRNGLNPPKRRTAP
jgi:hypothetical protein